MNNDDQESATTSLQSPSTSTPESPPSMSPDHSTPESPSTTPPEDSPSPSTNKPPSPEATPPDEKPDSNFLEMAKKMYAKKAQEAEDFQPPLQPTPDLLLRERPPTQGSGPIPEPAKEDLEPVPHGLENKIKIDRWDDREDARLEAAGEADPHDDWWEAIDERLIFQAMKATLEALNLRLFRRWELMDAFLERKILHRLSTCRERYEHAVPILAELAEFDGFTDLRKARLACRMAAFDAIHDIIGIAAHVAPPTEQRELRAAFQTLEEFSDDQNGKA